MEKKQSAPAGKKQPAGPPHSTKPEQKKLATTETRRMVATKKDQDKEPSFRLCERCLLEYKRSNKGKAERNKLRRKDPSALWGNGRWPGSIMFYGIGNQCLCPSCEEYEGLKESGYGADKKRKVKPTIRSEAAKAAITPEKKQEAREEGAGLLNGKPFRVRKAPPSPQPPNNQGA